MDPMLLRLFAVFLVVGLGLAALRTSVEMTRESAGREIAAKPARNVPGPAGLHLAATPGRSAH